MLFNSFTYVLFLWGVYVLFWAWKEKRPLRHAMVLVASYVFYGYANAVYTLLLAASTITDYFAGLGIERARQRGSRAGMRGWMGVSLAMNLGLLGTFKYFDFFADSFELAFAKFGVDASLLHLDLILPVGISFYTFQTLSYTIDIFRGHMKPTRSLLDFAVFVSFFPQLVAGPIVRAKDFIPQLEKPAPLERGRVSSGLFQILRGMTKKLLMADMLGAHLVDTAVGDATSLGQLGGPGLMLATYAYALQLYGDFAGYSDIAIGSARVLGFELRKNFDAPFKSASLEEFWTRWHISMSSWFTDYVYIGMGGSRVGLLKAARNAFVAWTLVGLWHGAAWTFVLWGMFHGACLVVSRFARQLIPGGRLPATPLVRVVGVLFTFHVVAFSMILFRCKDMASFGAALSSLGDWSKPLPSVPWQIALIMVLGYLTHFMPERWQERLEAGWGRAPALAQGVVLAAAILLFYGLRPPGLTPFVYFQF
ncbi:MAG: MBOAT family O-acyltransferase [Planctomycetota bacterium]|jgi:D-alanyl-lipoteichoic acid acyltransferase DltB (MBOAT superfamily)